MGQYKDPNKHDARGAPDDDRPLSQQSIKFARDCMASTIGCDIEDVEWPNPDNLMWFYMPNRRLHEFDENSGAEVRVLQRRLEAYNDTLESMSHLDSAKTKDYRLFGAFCDRSIARSVTLAIGFEHGSCGDPLRSSAIY